MAVDVLSRHNRVIHHNTQHQDVGKQADGVQGDSKFWHQQRTPHETHGDPYANPKGDRGMEE